MSNTKASAAAYCRVSTDEQAREGYSLAEQRRLIEQRAAEQGWKLSTYEDAGWSGAREDRPGLQRLLADAESGKIDLVMVWAMDRLARDLGLMLSIVARLQAAGARIESLTDTVELGTPEGELNFNVKGAVAQYERKQIGQRVRMAMKARARQGKYTGPRPYGYHSPGNSLVIVPKEAEVVRRIFAEFVAGRSTVAIARGLQGDRIPTATGKATWRQPTVSGLLGNPLYIGKVRSGDEVHEGQHEAIIDAKTWKRVEQLLAARSSKRGGRPPRGHHLLRNGMLRCGSCGDAMVPRTKTKPTWQEYYCCTGHIQLGNDYCAQGCIKRADIDEAVYTYFEKVGLDVEATREALRESRNRKLAEVRAALEDAERQAQEAKETFERIRADYKRGDLPAEEWRDEWKPELTEERIAAEAEVKRLREQVQEVEGWDDLQDVEAETLRGLAEIRRAIVEEVREAEGLEAVRAALTRLFESFTIYPDKAEISPKRRGVLVSFDLSDMEHPKNEVLTPSRVPLEIGSNKPKITSKQGSGCL